MAKEKTQSKESKGKKETSAKTPEVRIIPRLLTMYKTNIVPSMMSRFAYKNIMQVPRLDRISLNVGIGRSMQQDAKVLEVVTKELEQIVGQKVVVTKSKKSISNFKLRAGMPVGVRVTLRGAHMYEFLDRLVNVTIPRIRDFRGMSDKSFDGRGNYTIGLKEQVVFPEIDVDKVTKLWGMDLTFVTTASTDEEAYELLKFFGMPFVKRQTVVSGTKAA